MSDKSFIVLKIDMGTLHIDILERGYRLTPAMKLKVLETAISFYKRKEEESGRLARHQSGAAAGPSESVP